MPKTRSESKGICNRCGHLRTTVSRVRGYCKPCGYRHGHCSRCLAYRKIYVRGLCYGCYQDDLVRGRLAAIEEEFRHPASSYNRHIFVLYLTYLRRYRMSYDHLKPTLSLLRYLERHPVNPIRRWTEVYRLSRTYPLTRSPGKAVHDNGCAWMKIGYMLQELGVLGPRADEQQHRIDMLLEDMDSETARHATGFSRALKKSGRTDTSINRYLAVLRSLSHWLSELDPPETLFLANAPSIECYFEQMGKISSYSAMTTTFRRIAGFYRWARSAHLILQDPTRGIRLSRAAEKLVICSKTQFDQLNAFLRDADADVEQTMAVTLILFFGFTTTDLVSASLNFTPDDEALEIILARKPRSRGRRYYNRKQLLSLPRDPRWLDDLAVRFRAHWRSRFDRIQPKTSFPKTPLFLDPQHSHNRNLSDEYVRKLVKTATASATGIAIPPRVLRQTCGHIMTRGCDGSTLATLGWSQQFAFHYTWLPRVQFQAKSKI